jgi:hypothetical protein
MESVTFGQLAGLALVLVAATPVLTFGFGAWVVVMLTRDDAPGE